MLRMTTDEPDPAHRWRIPVRRRRPLRGLTRGLIQRAARQALSSEAAPTCEVSVLLTHDNQIQALNREWRGIDAPTDVLSFSLWEGEAAPVVAEDPPPLGDVVISVDTATRQAAELGVPIDSVVAHLVVHGVLHLLGFDHATSRDERAMRAREGRALSAMGLAPVLWPAGAEVRASGKRGNERG